MIFSYKPDPPALPFPTAFPGLGATLANPVSGQHATNPTPYRFNTIHPRTASRRRQKSPLWHNIPLTVGQSPFDNYPLENNLVQGWLTRTWKNTLTPTQRTAWAVFAAAHTLTNFYGQTKYLSPFGAFMHVNRLYVYNYVVPGHPPANDSDAPFPSPPATWTTIPTRTLLNFTLIVKTHPYPAGTYDPWYFGAYTTPPASHPNAAFLILMSYPNKIITAPRQGSITQCMYYPAGTNPSRILLIGPRIFMPALKPGHTVSIAYLQIDYFLPGPCATTWTKLVAGVNPY